MFEAAAALGGLDVQLVYFRGFNECRASNFVSGGQGLARAHEPHRGARRVDADPAGCLPTRATRRSAPRSARSSLSATPWRRIRTRSPPSPANSRCSGVKAFMFQEGHDPAARRTFSEIARLTGGAYGAFDAGASARLAALLRAAAAYAAGGHAALARAGGGRPRGAAPAVADARSVNLA